MQKTLVSDDPAYWKSTRDWIKAGDRPLRPLTETDHGCPFDCGLCPDHEQHSCLAIIEINDACNLSCPVCFADSSVTRTGHRSLAEFMPGFEVYLQFDSLRREALMDLRGADL